MERPNSGGITALMTVAILFEVTLNAQGFWAQKSNFGGLGRKGAVGFSIGNKGYIGLGASTSWNAVFQDLWEWDQSTDTWTQMAGFPGTARSSSVCFVIGNNAYVGMGSEGTYFLRDIWEWEQSTNTWTQKSNFPSTGRVSAVGFSIGAKGYVATGKDSIAPYKNDLWEYDPTGDTWQQKSNLPSIGRQLAATFVIGTKGYVGTGWIGFAPPNGQISDFWEWNSITDSWTQKASLDTISASVGFSIGGRGYVGTGMWFPPAEPFQNFWAYDTLSNSWIPQPNVPPMRRHFSVGFSIDNRGYIGTGTDTIQGITNDFWEFNPSVVGLDKNESASEIQIFPNPSYGQFSISLNEKDFKVYIYDSSGRLVHSESNKKDVNMASFPKGIYFFKVAVKEKFLSQRVVVQ